MSFKRTRIAARAHELWEQRGRPQGSPEVDWLQAEKELSESDANDASESNARFDPLQEAAAEALASDSDRSDTETTSPDGPIPKRSRGRSGERQRRGNGARN